MSYTNETSYRVQSVVRNVEARNSIRIFDTFGIFFKTAEFAEFHNLDSFVSEPAMKTAV